MRIFPANIIVSVYHNRMVCPLDEYRDFIDYMIGEKVWWHDMAGARAVIAKHLERKLPELKRVASPPEKTDSGAGTRYVKAAMKTLGWERTTLEPLRKGTFKTRTMTEWMAEVQHQ